MGSIPSGNVISGLIRKYYKSIRFFHFRYDFGPIYFRAGKVSKHIRLLELVSSQSFGDFPTAYAPRGVEDKYGLSHLIFEGLI